VTRANISPFLVSILGFPNNWIYPLEMRVNVSGKQFVFPRSCACCGAYPLTYLPVIGSERNKLSRTKAWSWEVPYCIACKKHIRRTEGILFLGLLLFVIACIFGALFALMTRWLILAGEVTGIAVLIDICLCGALLLLVKQSLSENCFGLGRTVSYLGSNGSCHSFDIKSSFYFAEFVRANHRKLVNASPRVVGVLKGTSFGNYQIPRRITQSKRKG